MDPYTIYPGGGPGSRLPVQRLPQRMPSIVTDMQPFLQAHTPIQNQIQIHQAQAQAQAQTSGVPPQPGLQASIQGLLPSNITSPQFSGPIGTATYQVDPAYKPLESKDIELIVRQQPREGLLAFEGKEKARKPIDPPPIVEIKVVEEADPRRWFLHNPYLFVTCQLIQVETEEPAKTVDHKSGLIGTMTSSLYCLKDNRGDSSECDGGFFIFSDISGRVPAANRLHFRLWEMRKDDAGQYYSVYLKSVLSDSFNIVMPKDFKGLQKSTFMSRSFSDQGVRIRLRKEPRSGSTRGKKRQQSDLDDFDDEDPPGKQVKVEHNRSEDASSSMPVMPISTSDSPNASRLFNPLLFG